MITRILITFFLITTFCEAQTNDSLWTIYNNKTTNDTNRIKALNSIAWNYRSVNPDSAIILAQQSLHIIASFNNKIPINQYKNYKAAAFNVIGFSYYIQANNIQAINFGEQALANYKESGNTIGLANSYVNMASYYKQQSNYPLSLDYTLKALSLFESIKDKKGIATSYTIIGQIFFIQSKNEKALDYYFKALKINREIGNKKQIASCLGKIGQVYYTQKDFTKALKYHEEALVIREDVNDKQGISASFINIGNVYADKHESKKAIDYYLKAIKIAKIINDNGAITISYNNIGELYSDLSDIKNAIKYYNLSLQLSKEIGDITSQQTAYENLYFASEHIGNYKEAYAYHVQFKNLTDSIFNEENTRQLADLNTQFEVEKKASELKLKSKVELEKLKAIADEEHSRQLVIIFSIIVFLVLVIALSVVIYKRFKVTERQNKIIEEQKVLVDNAYESLHEKNKELLDSIYYARRIQRALITPEKYVESQLNKLNHRK